MPVGQLWQEHEEARATTKLAAYGQEALEAECANEARREAERPAKVTLELEVQVCRSCGQRRLVAQVRSLLEAWDLLSDEMAELLDCERIPRRWKARIRWR